MINLNLLSYKFVSVFYYPSFGSIMEARSWTSNSYSYGWQMMEKVDEISGLGNHYTTFFRPYNPRLGKWWAVDPEAVSFAWQSPFLSMSNNPISRIDPLGNFDDWVESEDGDVYWDEDATSQATAKEGETYLGKNVLVGTHNRDEEGNEPINTATFDLYLESDKTGPSATIKGNTVPSDTKTSGTLAEGLYSARSQGRFKYISKGKEDLALIINEGKEVPTTANSPKSSMTAIFFHMGNNYQTSLFDSKGNAYSSGCLTSGCYPNSRLVHNAFMKKVGTNFNGTFYLRQKPVVKEKPILIVPVIVPFSPDIPGN